MPADNESVTSPWPIATFFIYLSTVFQIGYLIAIGPKFIPMIGLTDWFPSTIVVFLCLLLFFPVLNFSKFAPTSFSPALKDGNPPCWAAPSIVITLILAALIASMSFLWIIWAI